MYNEIAIVVANATPVQQLFLERRHNYNLHYFSVD